MSNPATEGSFDSIEAFVSTAEGVVATGQDLDEANTKAKILTPLVRTLGWPVHDNTEVLLEYSEEDQFDDRADYALFHSDELYAVIEAKQIGESLSKHRSQIRRYMRLYGAEWGLLTNGEKYQIFRSEDDADEVLVDSLSLADLPTSEHLQQLSRDSAQSEVEAPDPVTRPSEADIEKIVEISQEPDLYDQMVGSIAPWVYGCEEEKLAVLLALFGGVDKEISDRSISGAIDILFVHDPIEQFSELIDATRDIAPDSVYFSDSGVKVNSKPQGKNLIKTKNPKYGRFDQYKPIGEQIDYDPELISQFDLIFTVTDEPDPIHDSKLADHTLKANYAGELNTYHDRSATPEFTQQQVDDMTEQFTPAIDPDLLRKYIAHAKRNCYPTLTDEAKGVIREFYVDLRSKGADEDVPMGVTESDLETLIQLAEASARIRLSDTVEREDAERSVEIVRTSLQDTGVDPESEQFNADVVDTATHSPRIDEVIQEIQTDGYPSLEEIFDHASEEGIESRKVNLVLAEKVKNLISDVEEEYEGCAPIEEVIDRHDDIEIAPSAVESTIKALLHAGQVYKPKQDHCRTT